MKKLHLALLSFICVIAVSLVWLSRTGGDRDVHANPPNISSLLPGLSLMGAYGDGQDYFIPNENLVKSSQLLAGGWGTIERQEGVYDWSEFYRDLSHYEGTGKKTSLIVQTSAHNTRETPRWIYEEYGVRQITARGVFFDFSAGEPSTQSAAAKIHQAGPDEYTTTITGGQKNSGELRAQAGTTAIESTNHIPEFDTQAGFDYRGSGRIIVSVINGTTEETIKTFSATSEKKSAMFLIPSGKINRNTIVRIRVSEGEVFFNNLSFSARTADHNIFGPDRNLSYPNIFDPVFIEKQKQLAKAIYEEFKDHPNVGGVFVGGLGRWNELSLMGDSPQENELLRKQWRAYGYDDDKYIEHIDTMCGIYSDIFSGKMDITLLIAAFSLPNTGLGESSGDVNYVGYAANNMAVKYGFSAKHNGLTEKYTEWGQAVYAFNFFANRYKYDPNASFKLEAAIQINNPWAYWMGHPHSVFNRIMIDQMDNYFLYSNDLKLPFVMKYAHTANEQAGNGVFTRFYNILKRTPFKADHTWWPGSGEEDSDRILRNLWNGLYLVNERSPSVEDGNDEHKNNYAFIGGREVIKTSSRNDSIRFSLDDRQSYNVLYGSHVAITYYDTGSGSFDVRVRNTDGTEIAGSVRRRNTNSFKTAHFYLGDFFDTKHNGDKLDIEYEVEILSRGGTDYISDIEILSVPSIDWRERVLRNPVMAGNPSRHILSANTVTSFNIPVDPSERISSVDVFVGSDSGGYVLLEAKIFGLKGSREKLITTKEYYMPGESDILRLPVAKADYDTTGYRVELKRINMPNRVNGTAYVLMDTSGNYAYRTKAFYGKPGERVDVSAGSKRFSADYPFFGITINAPDNVNFTLQKDVGGNWVDIAGISDRGSDKLITFEPQNPGQYRIVKNSGPDFSFTPAYLTRRSEPHPPKRYNLGTRVHRDFLSAYGSVEVFWKPVSGFSDQKVENGIWSAKVTSANPSIETGAELSITPGRPHIFHLIMKNETGSDMVKLYWKNEGDSGYTQAKSAYITVVPNDDRFREYSYPIGQEASAYYFESTGKYTVRNISEFTYADTSRGEITGFKVVPVVGNTINAGNISIATMSLRDDDKEMSGFNEPLEIESIIAHENIFSVGKVIYTEPEESEPDEWESYPDSSQSELHETKPEDEKTVSGEETEHKEDTRETSYESDFESTKHHSQEQEEDEQALGTSKVLWVVLAAFAGIAAVSAAVFFSMKFYKKKSGQS